MDYKKLKTEIKEIAEIAKNVPEPFQGKCFEILLHNFLCIKEVPFNKGNKDDKTPPPSDSDLTISTQLRVFMGRTGITKEELTTILMVADNDVHFIREPKPEKIAKGQRDWALLLALKNCILENSLSVDPEDIRSICQEKGYYNRPNFASIMKKPHFSKLFKGKMEAQGEAQQLSNEGQDELAKLIKSLVDNY